MIVKYIFASTTISILSIISINSKIIASENAGLHIDFSPIKTIFNRHLVKFIGDCPGEEWSGIVVNGDIRFISQMTEPAKDLKVKLTNLQTGKDINRDYKKQGKGSNDFQFQQLGDRDGKHEIEYQIYHQDTEEILETGTFTYEITSSLETKQRDANWKLELFCSEDSKKKLNECNAIGKREVKYCQGNKTNEFRNEDILDLDRKIIEIDLNN